MHTSTVPNCNWTAPKSQDVSDWIAHYLGDINKGNSDCISSAWQQGIQSSRKITSQAFVPGAHARYIKQESSYVSLTSSKQIDLENVYVPTEIKPMKTANTDERKILNIMGDQLYKVVNREPSVFSPGIWPFGDNLLYTNLSYEEVKVIGKYLHPSQYYDVMMGYYETYRVAIQIADDDERNAKRHAHFQISMQQKFGDNFAKEIGNAHERGRPGTKEDNCVDYLNNKAARQYGKQHPGVDPATATKQMWSTGLLVDKSEKRNCTFSDLSSGTIMPCSFGILGLLVCFVSFLLFLWFNENSRNLFSGTDRRNQLVYYKNVGTENKITLF